MAHSGRERREQILQILKNSKEPVAGTELANQLDVSRQVIVQDMALIRANGVEVFSTNRGYLIHMPKQVSRVFKVIHTNEQVEEELNLFVDFGARVEDVFVYHKVYNVIKVNMLDKRTIQRDDNKKEVADMLLQDCYVQCEKNIEFLTPEMVKDNIVPKVNLDEMLNKNPIYKNLTELPFSSEKVILELAKDGQIIATKLKLFFEIKEQYRQYINMVIICYDRPEKTKEFLNTLMEKIKETKV